MSKKQKKLEIYKHVLSSVENNVDDELLEAITNYLGPNIYRENAETISLRSLKEIEKSKDNFVKGKLGIMFTPEQVLDKKIAEVKNKFNGSKKKQFKVVFYYLLTKKFGKENVFVDRIQKDDSELKAEQKEENVRKDTNYSFSQRLLCCGVICDLILIILIVLLLLSL